MEDLLSSLGDLRRVAKVGEGSYGEAFKQGRWVERLRLPVASRFIIATVHALDVRVHYGMDIYLDLPCLPRQSSPPALQHPPSKITI